MRSSTPATSCCVVCSLSDPRALTRARLGGGEEVVLCGTHALVYERSGEPAFSLRELRSRLGERRARLERRDIGGDALADALASGFSSRDRRASDRRAAR